MRPLDKVLGRLEGVRENGSGFEARCPVPSHGKGRGDRKPSLSIAEGEDGKVLLRCRAGCQTTDIVAEMGLRMRDLFPRPSNDHRNDHKKTR